MSSLLDFGFCALSLISGTVLEDFAFSYPGGMGISIPALEIPKGAIVGVIGRNGAGKTTFARCLCGLEKKAKGRLVWNGNSLSAKKRLKLSYLVMQDVNHQLFTESVHEEITLGMARSGDERMERGRRMKSLLIWT